MTCVKLVSNFIYIFVEKKCCLKILIIKKNFEPVNEKKTEFSLLEYNVKVFFYSIINVTKDDLIRYWFEGDLEVKGKYKLFFHINNAININNK